MSIRIARVKHSAFASRLFTGVFLAAALGGATVSALAGPAMRLAWSTYLRSGPGQTYRAVDELEHDTAVIVAGCSGGWCRVSADGLEGYIDRDALGLLRLPAPRPAAGDVCVILGQTDDRAPRPTRFCGPVVKAAPSN